MGMLTSGRIEVAAPASEVFAWLIEPSKLTAWLGGSGGMPEDGSQLHAGWTGSSDASPVGKVTVEIREYEPPTRLEYRSVYAGGDAVASYRLAEGDGVTTLSIEGDTDWARPEGAWVEEQLEHGTFDGMAQPQMQQALESALQKLKALIEAG